MVVGALCVPVTRRQLTLAIARSADAPPELEAPNIQWHRTVLVLASGLLPAAVILRAGWSVVAIPPLLLLLGLVQLAYCDLTRFLLPKTMVHATTAAIAISVLTLGAAHHEWHRAVIAGFCGLGLFVLLLAINLMNPAWMAFGDVRLAPAIGFGLGWISPTALFQGFILANVLAAVAGLFLIVVHHGDRKSSLPFGLYLALASAVVVFSWS
jgi:leader peptidase (prepilin peptidase) / N-methyltransferase